MATINQLNAPNPMKLLIKNMVCDRCIFVVEKQLNEIGITPVSVALGEVEFGEKELSSEELKTVSESLTPFGFEILDNRTGQLMQRTKTLLLELVKNQSSDSEKVNISDYLKRKFSYDYNYISSIFSSIAGITIEHYLIQLKIEKVKELLFYDELTLSQIAFQLGYSSVSHLSRQFKQVTGLTPSFFKKAKNAGARRSLNRL